MLKLNLIKDLRYNISDYPFKPPSDVHIVDVGLQMLTFSWSQNLNLSCDAIHYSISATSCGVCPSSTSKFNMSVTCIDITLSPKSTMLCSFSVLPVVCGNILGNTSNTAFTTLKSKLSYNNQKMVFDKHFN